MWPFVLNPASRVTDSKLFLEKLPVPSTILSVKDTAIREGKEKAIKTMPHGIYISSETSL